MKKIMKFFPVALAALAFVSCSDELTDNQAKNVGKFDNALYFTMESTSDATRAGIVGNATDNLNDVRFRWTKNDQVRVYDEKLAMYDVYQYGGESFVENTPASAFTNPAPWATKKLTTFSVGVYPNSAVEAVYLDKTDREKKHIVMNVPANYTFEAATVGEGDAAKEAYRCDVPMYGNINDVTTGVTEMNFLTAWTRIYTRNIPADVKYICVVSENDDQPLTGQFEAQVHYPLAATDEPWLQKKENVEETWGNIMYSDISLTPAAFREKGGICFPLLVQTYDNIHIYALKSTAGKTPEELGNNMTEWNTLLNGGQAIEIASKENLQITRRRQCWTVRYTYNYYLNTDEFDPFRPGEVSKVLAAQAANIIGDFKVIPYSKADGLTPVDPTKAKTLVSGEGDYYTHRIEIPQISPLANIVLDFSGAGIQYDEALQIYDKNPETNQFSGKLTIIPGKIQGGSAKAKIEVNLPLAKVWIVGDGTNDLGNVDIQNAAEVHIGDGNTVTTQASDRTTVFKGGKLYIEDKAAIKKVYAQAYAGDATQHAQELIVNPGGYINDYAYIQTQCNITLNGAGYGQGYDDTAAKLYTGTQNEGLAQINHLDCSAVKAAITIKSQGDTRIADVKTPTEGDKVNYLTIKTKMFQKSATDKAPTKGRVLGEINTSGTANAVFTGSQLTKLAESGTTADTYLYADEIDMNNVEWKGGAVSNNVYSINYNTTTHKMNDLKVAAQKQVSTATGLTEIKNLKLKDTGATANGLFGTLSTTATIAGIKLTTVDFTKNDAANNVVRKYGALVGNATAAATIDEVTVTGLTFDSKGASAFGGLIGQADADVTINDASVSATLKGRSFVGGLIGKVSTASKITIIDSKTPALTFALALRDGTSLQANQVGTFGSFIGGAELAATIVIKDCNFGTAITKAAKGNGVSTDGLRFGAVGNEDDEPFFGGNAWIGRFTGVLGTLTTYRSIDQTAANKGKNFYRYIYADKTMTQTRWNGAGNFAEANQKNVNGGALHTTGVADFYTYDGTSPATLTNKSLRYGTNIYLVYSNASLNGESELSFIDGVK